MSEASHALALILSESTVSCQSPHVSSPSSSSGLPVHYQNVDMFFTNCYSTRDFRTIYGWNEISQFSNNCIPIINRQSNIYYIHKQLHILIVDYRLRIPPCGSRCFPITTIDCVNPVLMYSQDALCIPGGILSHCSNRSLYVPTKLSDTCVQNGVLDAPVRICLKYHPEETPTSPVVQGMFYCSCSKKQTFCCHLVGEVGKIWPPREFMLSVLEEGFCHHA